MSVAATAVGQAVNRQASSNSRRVEGLHRWFLPALAAERVTVPPTMIRQPAR